MNARLSHRFSPNLPFRSAAWTAVLIGVWLLGASGRAQTNALDAAAQNRMLGRGVNVLGYDPLWRSFPPARFQARHFQVIRQGGFDSVRVNLAPFRHMGAGPDFQIEDSWLHTLDWVVTNALANDLAVILDLHEYNPMGADPEANRAKFLAFWRQVAPRFQDASPKIFFEILNEPSRQLTPQLWNQYLAEALAVIRATNPRRAVVVGPAFWNSVDHLDELRLPEDDRHLIVTVHYYKPMEFTHQGAPWVGRQDQLGVAWRGTPEEQAAIAGDFQKVQDWATRHHRPIFLGEFGAYDKADMASRARYTAAVARAAERLGWSWAYWQFDSDFVAYDMRNDQWVEPIHQALAPPARAAALGEFEGQADVGQVEPPGSADFTAAPRAYRVTGSGANIWGTNDAFHFIWRRVSGDLMLTANVQWIGGGKNPHRKAAWMVRQGLDAAAPYADVAVHGDGLISLQYRRVAGGPTLEVQSPVKAPATVRLERNGDLFTLSVARAGQPFQPAGAVTVTLPDPVYAGLAVCSHDATVSETAVFSDVSSSSAVLPPGQKRVRETSLEIASVETGERTVVYRARDHFEAPNWSRDGQRLLINRGGSLFTLSAAGGGLQPLDTGAARHCNNDHGFSPDGKWLAISSQDAGASLISVLPSDGGTPRRVTRLGPSYWHGWSPDGTTLAYCAERNGEFDVYTIPVAGGAERRLTTTPGLDDGPDYSPDGRFIYWNSERTGLMKIWRMNADGTQPEQVTTDADYADWFPHPSPDGKWLVFLSFDKSVKGHPENQDVVLRLMPLSGGKPRVLATLFGGQGTINVPSWSPDSRRLAFVSYRWVLP